MPAVSLTDLQQQIAQREQELQALRDELQTRQSHLSELNRRKQELHTQLRQVEEEIDALTSRETTAAQATAAVGGTVPSSATAENQPRLGMLIVTLLRESKQAMTARQLHEAAQRRGYQSSSRDPLKAIEKRLQDLKNQGIVRRASGQLGFLLTSSASGIKKTKRNSPPAKPPNAPKAPAQAVKSKPAAKKTVGSGSSSPGAAQMAETARRGGQPPLRVVLTDLLKSSRKPLSGSELAERALAAGYRTQSSNFVDTVWAMLGKMDNVEHLPEQGYRLKKS